MIQVKAIYMTHADLCELLDIPKDMGVYADEYALIYRPDVEMWKLEVKVGTPEEIDELAS